MPHSTESNNEENQIRTLPKTGERDRATSRLANKSKPAAFGGRRLRHPNLMAAVSPWPTEGLLYTPVYAYFLCGHCGAGPCGG